MPLPENILLFFKPLPALFFLMMWGLIKMEYVIIILLRDMTFYNKLLLWGDFCLWIEYTHTQKYFVCWQFIVCPLFTYRVVDNILINDIYIHISPRSL